MTVRVRSDRKNLTEWLDLVHNYLIRNYKDARNHRSTYLSNYLSY